MLRRTMIVGAVMLGALAISQLPSTLAEGQTSRDIETVRNRLLEPLLQSPQRETIDRLFGSMRSDGTFPSVDYADTSGGGWDTASHLSEVLLLARAWKSPESALRGDTKLGEAVMRSLDYWLEKDYTNRNWWWNQIGVPGRMARILLVLGNDIDGKRREKCLEITGRAKIGMTGANLVDVAYITVMRGIVENDRNIVASAVKSITDEIKISEGEGTQTDYSFHQHGALLYNHGYGAVFMSNCSELAVIVTGTAFAFPKDKIDIMNGLILDGTRWMIRYATKDYGATGRGISRRSGNSPSAGYLRGVVENMIELPTGREREYRDMLAGLEGESGKPLNGNRHFFRSDIMTHHRTGYYVSARMFSDRLLNTDRPHNGEGLKSYHLGDGCTYIMQSGMEYHDIFPVWDWMKIPGTTAEQAKAFSGELCRQGTRSFAGGASDGIYGAAAFDFERDGLLARKSWFFFDGEFVCLGAGITSPSANPVVTTVNQCFLKGSVLAPGAGRPKALLYGSHELDGVGYVHHDGITYVFPDNQRVRLENQPRTGSWFSINNLYSNDDVTHDVFTLWLDHGVRPGGASYSYIVAPGVPAEEATAFAANPPATAVVNTTSIQAVLHTGLNIIGAAFYEPGSIDAGGTTVNVDKPCILLAKTSGASTAVTVSNPVNKALSVNVTISSRGKASQTERFDLPGGMKAGSSVTRTVTMK